MVVAGRTSALAIEGIDGAIQRVKAYEEAGVDAVFLAGAKSRSELEAIRAEVKLPLLLGGASGELNDKEFLASVGVKVALQGHWPFQAAIKAVYDTLKALREGVQPQDLKDSVANSELIARVTRKDGYDSDTSSFL
jgi:carboxyvinyl-carboxyphosphonate phosphorylmutase